MAQASKAISGKSRQSGCCGYRGGLVFKALDACITQLKAQGPSVTCNESKEEEEDTSSFRAALPRRLLPPLVPRS